MVAVVSAMLLRSVRPAADKFRVSIPDCCSSARWRWTDWRRELYFSCIAAALRLAFSKALTCAAVGLAELRICTPSAAASALAFFSASPVTASCALTLRKLSMRCACAFSAFSSSCEPRISPASVLLAACTALKGRVAWSTAFSSTCSLRLLLIRGYSAAHQGFVPPVQ
ncbi:hypothetical protein G184_gp38 [Erwinia phage ENT90]|uniref:Uncharacterized protein n=1 Tax=Erwinia phage ENT90 TaxID=947843 RepID=F1BUT9_9CAUD|nr:hypothetical protein G184_gp38 [Erwinia phage ENT90]ADX32430.1 hypothetical protein [Erwinia phage ENT90]